MILHHHTDKTIMIAATDALRGRNTPINTGKAQHRVYHRPLNSTPPDHMQCTALAMGCFWGAEQRFWQQRGVWLTMVGYMGGYTANPTYKEVCSGRTGHAEVVRIVYDPAQVSYDDLLEQFWHGHNPTQGMRQGVDIGTQYRSMIFPHTLAQQTTALASKQAIGARLGGITTEIGSMPPAVFYLAEDYHQQYLA